MMWMFCLPLDVDGRHGPDLVAGGKGSGAAVGWFEAPQDPRHLARWRWHRLGPAGWIMSLRAADMDGDGDLDVLLSDRKGPWRGCRWLENPGPGRATGRSWRNHFLGGRDHEVMFLTLADLDGDRRSEVIVATRDNGLLVLPLAAPSGKDRHQVIRLPDGVGTGKGVAVGDLDGDGRQDLVFSCEAARPPRAGVMWLSRDRSSTENRWVAHPISGPAGIKFDRLELADLDGDGDLDVLACEESQPAGGRRRGLGVFWYENPF
ncbi:MAG TPA: VCBS repeat-containing protein [Planctomycetaceae bacterium]|nr:VCBS repeat-containing protein [Planctomycetaceae bacterium]